MKERLTITLDKSLLSSIDATIDGVTIRNRSHAIEQLLNSAMGHGGRRKAVIFAGGSPAVIDGRSMPAPMVPINGRPMIDYTLEELKRNGIYDIIIALGKSSESIAEHVEDGAAMGLKITYAREDSPRGTEGVLGLVRPLVGREPFFALNGDHIFTMNMDEMYSQHVANKALATVALTPASARSRFGVTRLEGNRITSFVQRHEQGMEPALVNAGIYLFNPEIFEFVRSSQGRVMLEESLFPKLVGMGRLFGYVFSGPWYSIDSTSNIHKSVRELERIASR